MKMNIAVAKYAIPFLSSLLLCDEDEAILKTLSFRTNAEAKEAEWKDFHGVKRSGQLTHLRNLPFKLAYEELLEWNESGASVYMTINETDSVGAKKENIRKIRAYWADIDVKPTSGKLDLESLPLAPTMVVKTPGGMHLYWVLEAPLLIRDQKDIHVHESRLRGIQVALARYGADPKVCEIARVLRVPGFWHHKTLPSKRVVLERCGGRTYCEDEIIAAFPPMEAPPRKKEADWVSSSGGNPSSSNRLDRALRYLEKCEPAIQGEEGSNTLFRVVVNIGPGFNLTPEQTITLITEHYNERCLPPWSDAEIAHKVEDAFRKEERRGWHLAKKAAACCGGMEVEDVQFDEDRENDLDSEDGTDPTRPCFGGFTLTRSGLFFQPEPKERGGELILPPPKLVSGPFEVLATVRDNNSHGWGLRVHWLDQDGVPHTEIVPKGATVGDPSELIRMFVDRGLTVFPDSVCRKKFVEYIARVNVEKRARCVDRIGWHGSAYVFPDETIGIDGTGEDVFLADRREHKFGVAGSLDDWKFNIARHAVGNSRLAFAISCPFASVLLSRLGMESGGINLHGKSSKGKTTCALAAGSVMGGPKFQETWRATSNGLESVAAAHNDNFLVLDEQGQALPNEAGEIAYMLANETDKIRSTRGLETRARRHWKLLFLSTAEITLAEKLREIGKTSKTGQDVRLVDVPANPDGLGQVFERWDGFRESKDLSDHLRQATSRFYGTPIRSFIKSLDGFPDDMVIRTQNWIKAWAEKTVPPNADSQVKRVADRFAVIAAAGRWATIKGILPWEEDTAEWAAATCFNAWLSQRGGTGAGEHQKGIQAVLEFIDLHGKSRFADKDATGEKVINMAGYRTIGSDGDNDGVCDYLFSPAGWKDACEGHNPTEVAKAMFSAGLLDATNKGGAFKAQKKVRVQGVSAWFYVVLGEGILAYRDGQVRGWESGAPGKDSCRAKALKIVEGSVQAKHSGSLARAPLATKTTPPLPKPEQVAPASPPKWEPEDVEDDRDEDARLKSQIRSSIDRWR